ncbi:MAG: BNR-4 repeat-containing protein [Pirellulales bacterium]|nr:BNR-4 repeat-containing protein [Pirellulales bacterium]
MKKTPLAIFILFASALSARAQTPSYSDYASAMLGNSYVDAYVLSTADHNIWPTDANVYTTVESWFGPDATGFWYNKYNSTKAINATALEGKDGHAPPQLTMTVMGLDAAEEYQIYAVYWAKNPALVANSWWYTRAALSGNSLIDCSYATADNIFFDDGGTGVQGCEKLLGTITGVTEFSIVVEAPPNDPLADQRAWFDGISTRGARTYLSTVEAHFDAGNSLSQVDGYLGARGNGWNDSWRIQAAYPTTATATVMTPTDSGFSEMKPGQSGYYLDVDAAHTQSATSTGLTRSYKSADVGINWTKRHSIEFSVRIDEDLTAVDFTHADDRYQFSNIDDGYHADETSTWTVACYGGASEPGETQIANPEDIGVWTFYDGDRDGAARTADGNVASDVAVTTGQVYDFTIVVDPETQSYDATVSDGIHSFTATGLGWQTAAAEIGQWLVFDTLAGNVASTEHRSFSLDDIVITQWSESAPPQDDIGVPEPSATILGTIAAAFLAAWRGIRRGRLPSQTRQCLGIGFTGVAILMSALGGMAMADENPGDYMTITPIRQIGSSTDELGYAASKVNATSFKQQSLTTVEAPGGQRYQYVSYYDADEKLVVGRRKETAAGWSDWHLRRTDFEAYNVDDSHDVSSIGVDGDGYVHISWGMHNNTMLYSRTTTSTFNDDPFVLFGDVGSPHGGIGYEMPHTSGVTYPLFYNIPGNGDLLFSYRTGSSGNGDMQLVRWDNAANAWNAVHAGTGSNPPLIDGDYFGDTLVSVNAYTNYAAFDAEGNWRLTWTWRTGSDSPTPFGDYQSNHNIMYAWSPNQGVDWYCQDGTRYSRSGIHAIDESNATPVVILPEGSSLINQTYMTTGPDSTPYVASWWAPNAAEGDHLRQYMLAWQDGDAWRTAQITDRQPENTNAEGISQRVPESQLRDYRMTRPIVAVDDDNRVIVAFTDWQRGLNLTIAYSESPNRDDWQFIDLPTDNMGWWEPTLDINRWKSDGVISMFYQVEQVGYDASVVYTFEWDAKAYFDAIAPIPGDANRDGEVNETDAQFLANHWGQDHASWDMGDFNRDGRVDAADAAILAANWGRVANEAESVPEPGSAILAILSAAMLAFPRRRRYAER